jgi:hypothetical protein
LEITSLVWLVLSALVLVWLVGACSSAPKPEILPAERSGEPVPLDSGVPSAVPSVSTPIPAATETPVTVETSPPPSPTPDISGDRPWGEAEAGVLSLSVSKGNLPLWAVFTEGMASSDPGQGHFVAIYTHDGQGWQELDRVVLTSCAEYVGSESLAQVDVEPSRAWLELQSGTGAHSGCYDLFSFDGEALRLEVSNWHSSPGAGWLEDLDDDGSPEVILNLTEDYVFYYASGLRYPRFKALRWDGDQLVEVQLSTVPQDPLSQAQGLNNRAVELARAGLWREARAVIGQALAVEVEDLDVEQTLAWNEALIELQARALADQVDEGVYPLLENAFYGDYDAVLDAMRPHSVEEIWGPETPLVVGTVAEGWEFELSTWISRTTNLALRAQPDLAPALLLRGWGAHLGTPGNGQTVSDVERAAELVPGEPLFAQSAAHLQVPISVAPPTEPVAYEPLPPEACYELGQALMNTLHMTVTQAEASLEDPLGGMVGTGCRSMAAGTGVDFEGQVAVSSDVKQMLEERGWDEDLLYAADGPTGTAAALRQGDDVCLLSVDWAPSEAADCPPDQPISACDLDPEQQLYIVSLNCARQAETAGQPRPVEMSGATATPASKVATPEARTATSTVKVATPAAKNATPAAEEAWQVRSLLVAPGEPGRLYVLQVDEPSTAWPATRARLLVSDDYGQGWVPFAGGLPAEGCVRGVNLDYGALPLRGVSDALYASTCQGLFRWSEPAWVRVSPQETGMVALVYGRPEVIWATQAFAEGGGVIRSDDGGSSWTPAGSGLVSFNGVANLGIDPRDANSLYAIIWPKYAGSYLRRGTADGLWKMMPTPRDNSVIDTGMTMDGATGALYVVVTAPNAQLWRTRNPSTPDVNDVRWELVHDFGRDVQVSLLASGWSPEGLTLYANVWRLDWKDANFAEVGEPILHRSLDGGKSWLPMPIR